MRKSITIIFIFVIHLQIFAQWEDLSIPSLYSITAVDFFDDNKGYIVTGGKVYKTLDGANTWNSVFESITSTLLEDIYIVEEDIVIAIGKDFTTDHSIIYRTQNGGLDWDYINISSSSILSSVFFPTPEIGFCVSLSGDVFKSIDAGLTWDKQSLEATNSLSSVYFINEFVGIAVGGSPFGNTIMRTVDGGSIWYPIVSPAFELLQSVYFSSDEIGYIAGWKGQILKTEDSGKSWELQTAVNMEGNLDVFFTDDDNGYVVGGAPPKSLIQKTTNGGELWVDISPDFGGGLIGIDFPSPNLGYAVGASLDSMGTLLKIESGGIISSIQSTLQNTKVNAYPNPFHDHLTLQSLDTQINLIRIFDFQGRFIKEINSSQQDIAIDTQDLNPNCYYLEIHTESETLIKRLIKI